MAEDTLNWWICRRAKQEKYGRQWYVKTCRQITRATMTWERRNRTRWSANSEIGQDPCRPPAREDGHRSNRKTRQNRKKICCGYKDGEDNEKIAKCLQHQGENRYLVLAKPRHQRTKSANECDERHYISTIKFHFAEMQYAYYYYWQDDTTNMHDQIPNYVVCKQTYYQKQIILAIRFFIPLWQIQSTAYINFKILKFGRHNAIR